MINRERIGFIIADDHTIFREGLKLLLDGEQNLLFLGEASNGHQLVELVRQEQPQIVFTDIVMPGMDGLNAVKEILKHFPCTGIIALSMFDEEQLIIDMMEAGALGYLLKDAQKTQLLEAIYSVIKGVPYYSESISRRMLKRFAKSSFDPYTNKQRVRLNDTEASIIKYICEGNTNKEIACKLGHTKRTVEIYRKRLMDKLELNNAAALVIYAIKKGIYVVGD